MHVVNPALFTALRALSQTFPHVTSLAAYDFPE
jgi:hypothetical protein